MNTRLGSWTALASWLFFDCQRQYAESCTWQLGGVLVPCFFRVFGVPTSVVMQPRGDQSIRSCVIYSYVSFLVNINGTLKIVTKRPKVALPAWRESMFQHGASNHRKHIIDESLETATFPQLLLQVWSSVLVICWCRTSYGIFLSSYLPTHKLKSLFRTYFT